jgi:hypothetical protein
MATGVETGSVHVAAPPLEPLAMLASGVVLIASLGHRAALHALAARARPEQDFVDLPTGTPLAGAALGVCW